MSSTTALFTGLSGLTVNSRKLEVIGNNIANVNTTAFKANRMHFTTAITRNFSLGTAPGDNSGGTNPGQIGLGVAVGGTQRNFTNGGISPTGIPSDLAIEGEGFYIVDRAGERFFTRAGAFQFNAANELVTQSGERLLGYGVDDDFNIVSGQLQPINVPLGTLTVAEATNNVLLSGNLNADGDTAVNGTNLLFDPFLVGGTPAVGTDLLTALDGFGLVDTDVITLSGATRGGKVVPDATFTVTAASTVDDFMTFLQDAMGVVPDGGFTLGDVTGAPEPGSYAIDGVTGEITFIGNFGTVNDLELSGTDISVADAAGVSKGNPFGITKALAADGESVRTTYIVYDSLGAPVEVDLTMVLAFKDNNGTHWRSFMHGAEDTDQALYLESGDRAATFSQAVPMIRFDTSGALADDTPLAVEVDRENTGAAAPLIFNLRFAGDGGQVTALADTGGQSSIAAIFQDGTPLGVLANYSVGNDGIVFGGFSNGLTRTLGQVVLATFTNPEGLIDAGNNLFSVGPNSGTPVESVPLSLGSGRIVGGALELSNVDLSQEFIQMILTSTGYSASSRVISTTDQLLQELLILGR